MLLQAVNFTGYLLIRRAPRFSVTDWKENVESLNIFPFWEETQGSIYFPLSTHRESFFFVASCKCCQQRLRALFICTVLLPVHLLTRTVFESICFPCFLHKLNSISRRNWSCEEISSSPNSDKAASFSSVVVKTMLQAYESHYYVGKSLHNKSRCLNTMKSFLIFKIVNPGILLYFQKVLTLKLGMQNTQFTLQFFFWDRAWDSEPFRVLESPRSLSVYNILNTYAE